jgi:flagellar assembly factor FliW
MELKTKYHGVIEVEETDFLHFKQGIPGFLEEKKFTLLAMDYDSPFYIMQSAKTSELGFVVANPFSFFKDYEFDLADHDKEALKISNEAEIGVYTILTVKEPFSETTVNLQAPIIINHSSNLAKQVILNDTTYTTRHKIIEKVAQK